jgi:hypothetical protein
MLRRLLDRFNGADPTGTRLRLARLPRDSREDRVARILTRLPLNTHGALVEAVADDLRLTEDDPFRSASEVGIWRLAFYRRSAEQLVGLMVGDLLKEEPAPRAR